MDFKSCSVINENFIVTEEGKVACTRSQVMVNNGLEKAYVLINLFFYDKTQKEIEKLTQRIHDKRQAIISTYELDEKATDKIYPQLSSTFKQETGGNSLDGLIKMELGKIQPHLSLKLTPEEEEQVKRMREAIYKMEFEKFKKNTIILDGGRGKPVEIDFSPAYIESLPQRAKKIMAAAIKMLAYMLGMQFATFELTPDYQLKYTWSTNMHAFNEEELKTKIKATIAEKPFI